MAGNRKQPFGYRILCGKIVPYENEAETVRWIFETYVAGATYSALVEALQDRGVPYDAQKPWNKNMVARILDDRRYIGEGGFPQILKQEQFNASQVSKQERVPPRHQTPAQKELRRLCGSTPPSWVEGQVLGVLNGLIENPDMISCTADAEEESEISALRRQLDDALHSPPVEEAQIRSSVLLRNMTGKDNTMTKFFMRGTPLAGLEKQMMTPPNFTPRGGGRMILNRFRYRPEDVVCKNCTQCIHGKCSATICPWIEERAEAGVISYSSLAWEYYRNLWGTSLGDRITQLLPGRESITYYNEAHASRFSTYYPYLIHRRDDCPEHRQLAALYLLTATEALRRQALPRVFALWPVAGDYWKTPRKLTEQEYVLYQAAKGLYLNQPRVRISELADRELVDDISLSMILDAVLLVHYGKTVLTISQKEGMQ